MLKLTLTIASLGALAACSAAARPTEEAPIAPAAIASEVEYAAPDSNELALAGASEVAAPESYVAAAPAAMMPVAAAYADVRCDIRVRRTANGVELEAVARSDEPALGEYEFVITKSGAAGSSDIVQGGAFDLGGGHSQSLGLSEIGMERGARYRARLVLSDHDGVVCEDRVRS